MIWKRYLQIFTVFYLILGSWKGYVALFEKNSQEPCQIFPCQISALPEADQITIEQGIPIRNQRDLQQIIEDYLS